jgi:hypothetical protein
MRQLKNKAADGFAVNKMSEATYALRRKVIDIIYEVKNKGFVLPRVEVRVVSPTAETESCGYAYMERNIIHISEAWINGSSAALTHIVLHELLHAVLGIEHDDNCYLMQPRLPNNNNPILEKSWSRFAHHMKNKP